EQLEQRDEKSAVQRASDLRFHEHPAEVLPPDPVRARTAPEPGEVLEREDVASYREVGEDQKEQQTGQDEDIHRLLAGHPVPERATRNLLPLLRGRPAQGSAGHRSASSRAVSYSARMSSPPCDM